MTQKSGPLRRRWRNVTIRNLRHGIFSIRGLLRLGAVLLLVIFELWQMDRLPIGNPCALRQKNFDLHFEKLLPAVVRWRFDAVPTSRVIVVTLPPDEDRCSSRSTLATLVKTIQDDGARVIVIDKYYDAAYRCNGDDIDKRFNEALHSLHIPVVLGQPTAENTHASQASSCLYLVPTLPFLPDASMPDSTANKVKSALTRITEDPMQIPLRWSVFRSDQAAAAWHDGTQGLIEVPSLALAAALQIDSKLDSRELKDFKNGDFPYTSYTDPPEISANSLLQEPGSSQDQISGKVVVLGEFSQVDEKPFPGGTKYGVQLQANYIESLLDARFLKPLNPLLDLGLLMGSLMLLHIINAATEESWVRRLGYSLLTLFLLFLGSTLLMLVFNYFPPLRTVLAVVLNPFILTSCVLGEDALKHTPKIFKLATGKGTK